eukprot:13615257-Alexandrium_andersonii.AAC.1
MALKLTLASQPRNLVHERGPREAGGAARGGVKGTPEVRRHVPQQRGDLLVRQRPSVQFQGVTRA